MNKSELARIRLQGINPEIQVVSLLQRLQPHNAVELVEGFDVVIDGSDNFQTRYILSDVCRALGKAFIYSSVSRFEGQLAVLCRDNGPCYRCLYPKAPSSDFATNCSEVGVLGPVPGILGLLQAQEAIKVITGFASTPAGQIIALDLIRMEMTQLPLSVRADCPSCCGEIRLPLNPANYGTEVCQSKSMSIEEVQVFELQRLINQEGISLVDVRESWEREIASIGGLHIPIEQLPLRLSEVPREGTVVFYCHHGQRSLRAASLFLQANPAGKGVSLAGGIDAWSDVDQTVAKY